MRKGVLFLLLIGALSSVVGYAADTVVERPVYSAGDYWIYTDGKGRSSKLEFIREEKETYVFRRGETEVVRNFSLMDVSRSGGFPGPIIKFPLKNGAWWNYEYTTTGATGAESGKRIVRYEASGPDKITVAAGTFDAWKVTVSIEARSSSKAGSTFGRAVGSAVYWYAPEVKQVIRSESGEQSWELKAYKIK